MIKLAESVWKGFLDTVSTEEKVLPQGSYKVVVDGARPFVRGGEVQRGIFLELIVTEGPQKNTFANVYINIPEVGNRKAGFWYAKKMAGFGDLTKVYESMPEDLESGLEILCAALIGKECWAELGPGAGDYSNRNNLSSTKPLGAEAPVLEVPAAASNGHGEVEALEPVSDDEPGF